MAATSCTSLISTQFINLIIYMEPTHQHKNLKKLTFLKPSFNIKQAWLQGTTVKNPKTHQ